MESAKNIYKKLAEIGQAVGVIPKEGRNQFHNYDYATEADFKKAVRKPFFERGLCLIPKTVKRENYQIKGEKDKMINYVDLEVEFTIYDGETKESVVGVGYGTGSDSGDKAIWKAYAGCLKYFLSMTFMIPTGDDPEADERTDRESEPEPKPGPKDEQITHRGKVFDELDAWSLRENIDPVAVGDAFNAIVCKKFKVDSRDRLSPEQWKTLALDASIKSMCEAIKKYLKIPAKEAANA